MPSSWLDDTNEQQGVDDERTRIDAGSTGRFASQTGANASELRKLYPWLTYGAAWAIAKRGDAPTSQAAAAAAKRAADRRREKSHGWWSSVGDAISNVGDFVTPEAVEDAIGKALRVQTKPVRAGVRGAAAAAMVGQEATAATARQAVKYNAQLTADTQGYIPSALDLVHGDVRGAGEQKRKAEGIIREFGEADPSKIWSTTTLGVITDKLMSGDRVDLGEGWLPGGEVAEEQRRRARADYSIAGHAGTLGRIIAYEFVEPGTTAYNMLSGVIDAAAAIKLDPVAVGLGELGALRNARNLIDPSAAGGLINGLRRGVVTELAEKYLASADGRKFLEWAAGEGSAMKVWKAMGGKISADDAAEIAKLTSPAHVADFISPKLGVGIREKPFVTGNAVSRALTPVEGFSAYVPEAITKRIDGVRLLHTMPGHHVNPHDPTDVAVNLMRFAQNAKLSPAKAEDYFNRAAAARGPIGQFNVVNDVMSDVAAELGVNPKVRNGLTRMYENYASETAKYYTDDIGHNTPVLGAIIQGQDTFLPTPHMFVEYVNRAIPLPDARALRRATSTYGRVLDHMTLEGARRPVPVALLDFVFQDVWKPLTLLRGAWTVRVVGEEQVRMAANGLTSVVNHPIHAISWIVGRKGNADALGENFDALDDMSDFARALTHRGEQWRDRVGTFGRTNIQRGMKNYVPAWADELATMHADPIVSRVAGGLKDGDGVATRTGNAVDDVKEWFWSGAGQKFRKDIAEARGREELLTNRAVADALIDSYWQRVQTKTRGNVELIEAIGTGKVGDTAMFTRGARGFKTTPAMTKYLDELAELKESPTTVVGDITRRMGGGTASDTGLDRAVDHMFNTLMSRPTNRLSRSPAFRQFYWQRIEELFPSLTREAQQQALTAARDAKLDRAVVKRLVARQGKFNGDLDLKDADVVAKAFGLDNTKKLLYDMTQRSQFFDITRHIFPFGEAWKEVLGVWAHTINRNPAIPRRAQVAIQGALGSGFFHPDERGDLVFNYPTTGWIQRKLTGLPMGDFTGRVAGLNIFSENPLIPGFGPAAQIPAALILRDKPGMDWLRNAVLPFGEPEVVSGGVETLLPPWFQKFRQATGVFGRDDPRVWASTVMEVARVLNNERGGFESWQELEDAATPIARKLYLIRAAAQFFAPSAPSPKFQTHDPQGRLLHTFILTEKFHELLEEDRKNGTDTAVSEFLALYGQESLLFMQGKSAGGGPMTTEGVEWVRRNKAFVRAHPDTYAYFAPQGEGFDYDAYTRLVKNGDIRQLPFREWVEMGNQRVAGFLYRHAREEIGDSPDDEQRVWLRDLKEKLADAYPGYNPRGRSTRNLGQEISELRRAIRDPAVADTELADAVDQYLEARDNAIAEAKDRGYAGFGRAKGAEDLRSWLRETGATLSRDYAGFRDVFDRIFEWEFETEDDGEV